jgi:hypothetical protein
MKLKDARDYYYFYSGKTSDIVRQLALGGIGIVWLFRAGAVGAEKIPAALKTPLGLIVAGLAFDLLHYAIATSVWGVFQRRKEVAGTAEDVDFTAPDEMNYPSIGLFVIKVACVVVAYVLLLAYVTRTVF